MDVRAPDPRLPGGPAVLTAPFDVVLAERTPSSSPTSSSIEVHDWVAASVQTVVGTEPLVVERPFEVRVVPTSVLRMGGPASTD